MSAEAVPRALVARDALLPDGWARDVLLHWDEDGLLTGVRTGVTADGTVDGRRARDGAHVARGPVVPGMPNLHSHAFQRAFAGLGNVLAGGGDAAAADSFWTWREQMYRVAGALDPAQVEAVAHATFVGAIEGGYTSVCEFHYLHHDHDGRPYADDAELAMAVVRAAVRAGIGLTLLPVLYQRGGFDGRPARAAQRRFVHATDSLLRLCQTLRERVPAGTRIGIAPHSLRAVSLAALHDALAGAAALDPDMPVHIHVAEQRDEVEQCIRALGCRPLQWLLDHAPVDDRWCLVHATHLDAAECDRAARRGAVAGLCPTTEADLGDGLFDAAGWRAAGGRWGIGSDSQVALDAGAELRLLEWGQRLALGRRNVFATAAQPHVATAMWLDAVRGGAQAAGRAVGGLRAGQRADFVVLDGHDPLLADLSPADALSLHVFGGLGGRGLDGVWIGGVPRAVRERDGRAGEAAGGTPARARGAPQHPDHGQMTGACGVLRHPDHGQAAGALAAVRRDVAGATRPPPH